VVVISPCSFPLFQSTSRVANLFPPTEKLFVSGSPFPILATFQVSLDFLLFFFPPFFPTTFPSYLVPPVKESGPSTVFPPLYRAKQETACASFPSPLCALQIECCGHNLDSPNTFLPFFEFSLGNLPTVHRSIPFL